MTITTTQVSGEDALRAVADGKSVQMVWTDDGRPFFSDFTEKIKSAMTIGEAFLIVNITEDEPTEMEIEWEEPLIDDIAEEIADSQQEIADTCENAAEIPETIVTDPDTTPITVTIPNSHREEKLKRSKVDDELILKLRKDGLSEMKIANEMDISSTTVHIHLQKLRKEGRL